MNNRIRSAVKLDFYTGRSSLKTTYIALLIIAIVLGFATMLPLFSVLFTMVFAVFSAGTVFSAHEKAGSEKLYGILPLKKTEMIAGRYLYALLIGVIGLVIAFVLDVVITLVLRQSLDPASVVASLSVGFAYFGFAVGVSYPIYLKFSFAKAYVFTMLPMYIVIILIMLVTRISSRRGVTNPFAGLLQFFTDHAVLVPVLGAAIGLAFLAVSAVVANLVYTRKEI